MPGEKAKATRSTDSDRTLSSAFSLVGFDVSWRQAPPRHHPHVRRDVPKPSSLSPLGLTVRREIPERPGAGGWVGLAPKAKAGQGQPASRTHTKAAQKKASQPAVCGAEQSTTRRADDSIVARPGGRMKQWCQCEISLAGLSLLANSTPRRRHSRHLRTPRPPACSFSGIEWTPFATWLSGARRERGESRVFPAFPACLSRSVRAALPSPFSPPSRPSHPDRAGPLSQPRDRGRRPSRAGTAKRGRCRRRHPCIREQGGCGEEGCRWELAERERTGQLSSKA